MTSIMDLKQYADINRNIAPASCEHNVVVTNSDDYNDVNDINECAVSVTMIAMGLLPDTQNCGCACVGNAGNVFPVTAGKRSRHASRHVRHARAVMHAGIAN